jgi:hypothetical protein
MNHRKLYELRLIRPQTQHKNPEEIHLKFLIFFKCSSKFINQEIKMCNLVNVDNNGMAAISTEVIVKGFKKCCLSSAVDESDMLWNGNEEDRVVRSECKEDEGSACENGASDTGW